MPTAWVLLAEGAEEIETVAVVDVLRRAEVKVILCGLDGARAAYLWPLTHVPSLTHEQNDTQTFFVVRLWPLAHCSPAWHQQAPTSRTRVAMHAKHRFGSASLSEAICITACACARLRGVHTSDTTHRLPKRRSRF